MGLPPSNWDKSIESEKADPKKGQSCPSCGTEFPDDVKFCTDCGTPSVTVGMRRFHRLLGFSIQRECLVLRCEHVLCSLIPVQVFPRSHDRQMSQPLSSTFVLSFSETIIDG